LIQAKLFHPEVLNDSSVAQFVRPLASGAQACTLQSTLEVFASVTRIFLSDRFERGIA
jgi:hypothetical protein